MKGTNNGQAYGATLKRRLKETPYAGTEPSVEGVYKKRGLKPISSSPYVGDVLFFASFLGTDKLSSLGLLQQKQKAQRENRKLLQGG